uniref:SAP domain-containing protein n=1 Tax=Spongospora subterranea TaxID=70186 RepID=A0A0H5R803_9EUKA|eukprot:CRZ09951.1 hypothetical protein [Spongospora subterranea]
MTSSSSSLATMRKLKVVDLREQLTAIGLPTDGVKADLVDRLFKALHSEQSDDHGSGDAVANDMENADLRVGEVVGSSSPKQLTDTIQSQSTLDARPEDLNVPDSNESDFNTLKLKRAERFGVTLEEPKSRITGKNSAEGMTLGQKRKRGDTSAPTLNMSDPDIQRRLNRFGVPTNDPNSIIAKSVQAAETAQKMKDRKQKFGVNDHAKAVVGNPGSADFQAAVEARKLRFSSCQ